MEGFENEAGEWFNSPFHRAGKIDQGSRRKICGRHCFVWSVCVIAREDECVSKITITLKHTNEEIVITAALESRNDEEAATDSN